MKNFKFKFSKTVQALLLTLLVISFFSTCKKDPDPKSSEKEMTNVNISASGAKFSAEWNSSKNRFEFIAPVEYQNAPFNQEALKTATIEFTLSKLATSNYAGGPVDLTVDYTITVTAEDTSTKDYVIHKEDGTSDKKEIRSFSMEIDGDAWDSEIDKTGKPIIYYDRVPDDMIEKFKEAKITFTLSVGATANPQSGSTIDLTMPDPDDEDMLIPAEFEIVVTAHDGSKKTWTIMEQRRTDCDIDYFYLDIYKTAQSDYETDQGLKPGEVHIVASIDVETQTITYIMPVMDDWFTPAKMNVYPSVIQISNGATVVPNWNVPQDFSKDVKYTVTAEDGITKKEWTVKALKSYMVKKWSVEYASLEGAITDGGPQNPNSIAIIGDYLYLSRTKELIKKADGTMAGINLNIKDIYLGNGQTTEPTDAYRGQDYPFFVVNDEAGNMLGCTLGAWNTNNFVLYKWTTPTEDPEVLMDFPTKKEEAQFGSFGRKLQVLGDVNGKGLIISPNSFGFSNAGGYSQDHYLWKINNGTAVIEDPTIVHSGVPYGSWNYQILTPLGPDPVGPYYIGTNSVTIDDVSYYPSFHFGDIDNTEPIPGPFTDAMIGSASANGWGNLTWLNHKLFTFAGKNMIATFSMTWSEYYCFAVLERNNNSSPDVLYTDLIEFSSATSPNGNSTGGFTLEKDGNDVLFYLFPTNKGVYCYKLSAF